MLMHCQDMSDDESDYYLNLVVKLLVRRGWLQVVVEHCVNVINDPEYEESESGV
jgi:hypothetical protein